MTSVLIVQERGRNHANWQFRESENFRRSFTRMGVPCEVWGLNQPTFSEPFESVSARFDVVFVIENYDQSGWLPNFSKIKNLKAFWSIDSHCAVGEHVYFSKISKFDIHLNSTEAYLRHFQRHSGKCVWFPNAYPADLFELSKEPAQKHGVGFCGSMIAGRKEWLSWVESQLGYSVRKDVGVLGEAMVRAVGSYSVGLNSSIADDINYRVFETLGAGTCLLTNRVPGLESLFDTEKHLVVYESMQEMVKKARFLVENPDTADSIARAGYEHVRTNHTYDHRAAEFLRIVEGKQ